MLLSVLWLSHCVTWLTHSRQTRLARQVPPLRFGLAGDGKARHVWLLLCQRTVVSLAERRLMDMGRMKDIAITLARVEQLANELIVLSERPCSDVGEYARALAAVGEIAWKLVDAVRQD